MTPRFSSEQEMMVALFLNRITYSSRVQCAGCDWRGPAAKFGPHLKECDSE